MFGGDKGRGTQILFWHNERSLFDKVKCVEGLKQMLITPSKHNNTFTKQNSMRPHENAQFVFSKRPNSLQPKLGRCKLGTMRISSNPPLHSRAGNIALREQTFVPGGG